LVFHLYEFTLVKLKSTDKFAVSVLEQGVIFWVLVDHHIKVLSAFRVLHIQPYLLTAFAPITEVTLFNIAPNMFELFACDSF
jgi:hypothetical protein